MATTTNPNTVRDCATQRLDDLLAVQRQERANLLRQIEAEEAEAVADLRAALRSDAGSALTEALAALDTQLRAEHQAGRLHGHLVTSLPAWARRALPTLSAAERSAGVRSALVFVDREDQHGTRLPVAVVVADVSDTLFGPGSRVRADAALAAQEAEVEEWYEGMAQEREREAQRR